MSLEVDADRITSTVTEHHAVNGPEGWLVTWLPGRKFDRNAAITAMLLVEIYVIDPPPKNPMWKLAENWEREISVNRQHDWHG
ncbi:MULTISPECIES: hypothetical protein [Amycolatopsis]|uniref:hypothetical protein n=1 Tax=Amycolatopsis TaxID=1813 RepID=UPI00026271D5|nr:MULTISPECIES: hypothetical protein [Amycolatopsis]